MSSVEKNSGLKTKCRVRLPKRGRPPNIPETILALFKEGDEVPGIGLKPIKKSKNSTSVTKKGKSSAKVSNKSRQIKSGRGRKLEQTIRTEDDSKPSLLPSTAKCDVCGRTFSNISGFKRHIKACQEAAGPALVVKIEKILIAEMASSDDNKDEQDPLYIASPVLKKLKIPKMEGSSDEELLIHDNIEAGKFSCNQCNEVFTQQNELTAHIKTHTKSFECEECHRQFSRKYHLDRHKAQTGCDGRTKSSFPCEVCGKEFSRKDNLREHLRGHAGQVKRKRKFACEFCGKEFFGLSMLQVHVRSHTGERPYGCSYCDKSFSSNNALQKHIRTHTGERPFECPDCQARFAAKETLNRHARIHSGLKPHICEFCGKGFIQPSQLKAHLFHHTGENGFECEECGKSFNRRNRLALHIKYVHEGAEPFSCDSCDKKFIRKEDLSRHQLLHEGIKPHKCNLCDKSFSIKSALKVHLLTHTKEPPTSCDECGRAFIRRDCLLRHMRLKHRDMLEQIMADAEKKKLQQQLLTVTSNNNIKFNCERLQSGTLEENLSELLSLLVDESTLKSFDWPNKPVQEILEAVIRRCGHEAVSADEYEPDDCLRENAKLLFTVVIDDHSVKSLLDSQSIDNVIKHVLELAKA